VKTIHPATYRHRIQACAILLLAQLAHFYPPAATAHELFTTFIQHCFRLSVDARYMDLTVELTFFEEWSARERRIMDADGDGRITRPELEAYLKIIAPVVAEQVRLRLGESELPLALLYDPEVDLLGNSLTIPGHHRLRLHFFAPKPARLTAHSELIVEDRLWPDARALASVSAEGHDGATLEAESPDDPALATLAPGQAHRFKIRCLKPPAIGRAAAPPTHRRPAGVPAKRLPPLPPHPQNKLSHENDS